MTKMWSSLIVVSAAFASVVGLADAASLRNNERRHRGTRSRSDPERPYFWMCPEVTCPAISADCETVEYIVFQYDYMVRGRLVNVRCESCEYCLDGPFNRQQQSRQRRSVIGAALSATDSTQTTQCPEHIQCPSLPVGCVDERLTDLLVPVNGNSVVCKRCPACYDNTVLNEAGI